MIKSIPGRKVYLYWAGVVDFHLYSFLKEDVYAMYRCLHIVNFLSDMIEDRIEVKGSLQYTISLLQ